MGRQTVAEKGGGNRGQTLRHSRALEAPKFGSHELSNSDTALIRAAPDLHIWTKSNLSTISIRPHPETVSNFVHKTASVEQ